MIFLFEKNPFHIVEESPWPLLLGWGSLNFLISFVAYFWQTSSFFFCFLNLTILLFILFFWGRDITREGSWGGFHTKEIEKSMSWSMMWFITSEIFFFVAFFWSFFCFSLSSTVQSGDIFPPLNLSSMETFSIPLLNTIILLSSGVSLTWSHHSVLAGNFLESIYGMTITILLGIYFTLLQIFEYSEASFSFNDSIYGSIFFLATGFHGFHVFVGTLLLSISFFRLKKNHFMSNHHIGIETASWYWHFVDVVWLFLFCCVYWWGGFKFILKKVLNF